MKNTCNCASTVPDFPDVDSCLAMLSRIEPAGSVLFRGESCIYPTSTPGTFRVLKDEDLSFEQRTFLIDAVGMLQEWFEEHYPGEIDDRDMFLQHYGLPTDLLDFTDSAKIVLHNVSQQAQIDKGQSESDPA